MTPTTLKQSNADATSSTTRSIDTERSLSDPAEQLPVIIVGAGPCGLVAALALKQYGIPFVIIERASRSKICSNAGSGFELAPTAVEILQNRLGIDVSKIISYYQGMEIHTIEGKKVRRSVLPADYSGGSVNRAAMQNFFLETLFPTSREEEGVLVCGSGILTYFEDPQNQTVVATLASGETIRGCVLLACDGIHSRCRAVLHGGYEIEQDAETNAKRNNEKDPLHFCGAIAYWGKTQAPRGSDLEVEFSETQKASRDSTTSDCTSFVMSVSTTKAPACLFIVPSMDGTMLNWAITVSSETPQKSGSNDGTDLTRRGGGPLTEAEKAKLFGFGGTKGSHRESLVKGIRDYPLLQKLIELTPASDITEAGLFDRANLNLPYSSESKLVALLGDAAHPQTPFLGQGVNMAITDAYVYATNIAMALGPHQKTLREAIRDSDTDRRRKQAKSIIRQARALCSAMTTANPLVTSGLWMYGKFAPASEFMNQIVKTDKSNKDYLKQLDEKIFSPKQQEDLRKRHTQREEQPLRTLEVQLTL